MNKLNSRELNPQVSANIGDVDFDDEELSLFQKMVEHNQNLETFPEKRFISYINQTGSISPLQTPRSEVLPIPTKGKVLFKINDPSQSSSQIREAKETAAAQKEINNPILNIQPQEEEKKESGQKEKPGMAETRGRKEQVVLGVSINRNAVSPSPGSRPILKKKASMSTDSKIPSRSKKVVFADKKAVFSYNPNKIISKK
jgi:hypothetical protein